MNWSMASILYVLSCLAAIATIVLFIIACTSNTPFNMGSRQDGLLVSLVLGVIGLWLTSAAMYNAAYPDAPGIKIQ